jgi:K+-transporting ATPase ATPase C chain
MNALLSSFRPAILSTIVLTVLFGGVYPAVVTGIGKLAFPAQAEGSLIRDTGGKVVGSRLIGQNFDKPQYVWGRLSATSPTPYNAAGSSGSNFGVNNPALLDAVKGRLKALHDADPDNNQPVPVDLVTASASGLDPEITPAAAYYQAARVAKARNISVETVNSLIADSTKGRTFGVLGEPRVNVLELNMRLDGKLK